MAVNYSGHDSQCHVALPWPTLDGWQWRLVDALGDEAYERDGADLAATACTWMLRPWRYNVFELRRTSLTEGV